MKQNSTFRHTKCCGFALITSFYSNSRHIIACGCGIFLKTKLYRCLKVCRCAVIALILACRCCKQNVVMRINSLHFIVSTLNIRRFYFGQNVLNTIIIKNYLTCFNVTISGNTNRPPNNIPTIIITSPSNYISF